MALLDLNGKLALISLETPDSFIFELFPQHIQDTDRDNWEAQDVTIGKKPLFYASSEPIRLSIPELILDATRTNGDIINEIRALRKLKEVLPKTGAPPALLAVWGEEELRCVMEEVSIDRSFFTPAGNAQRARVSLQLIELQEEGTAVSSTVTDVEGPPF